MTFAPGETIGHFRVLRQLGAGGMGVVYLAEDLELGRHVALKVLSAAPDPDAMRRLWREARAAGALDHPNIAAIHEVFDAAGVPLIVMGYCPGETLRARLDRGPLPLPDVAPIASQIAAALAAAHEAGVVHRDLKPANIMLGPDGHVRVLDFGVAVMLGDSHETLSRVTGAGTAVGTVAYMAPEQVRGELVDTRADIWAFGVVLYEMLAGRRPFEGPNVYSTMEAIVQRTPDALPTLRADTPGELAEIVDLALDKDRARRTLTAPAIQGRIEAWRRASGAVPPQRPRRSRRWRTAVTTAVALAIVAVAAAGAMWYRQVERARWARDVAIPRIHALADAEDFDAAFDLAREAQSALSGSGTLDAALRRVSRRISIDSTPDGAEVRHRKYGSTGAWRLLGTTPIRDSAIPLGLREWKISKPGFATVQDVGLRPPHVTIARDAPRVQHGFLLDQPDRVPRGMVHASPRGPQLLGIAGLEHVPPFELADYWIDRYEVTNREYKAFVDAGGYSDRRLWKVPFVRNGRELAWAEGMALLRDRTGRAGPSTWELGTYPNGRDNEPVGGVSWYEAAAYAEFAGRTLPTIFHWSAAADRYATSAVLLRLGRYSADSPLAVGRSGAQSRYGTFDMAGNVKEWCWNEAGNGRRYTLGGGFEDPPYFFNDPDARSPWDREPSFGFRTMNPGSAGALTAELARPIEFFFRDFSRERPAHDQVFRAYASSYAYDRGELAPQHVAVDDSARDWRVETVTYNAAYGGERLSAYVVLPKRANPPFQTLVVFPGINAIHQPSGRDGIARVLDVFDYVVQSGRVMVMPVYKSTHERRDELTSDFPTTTAMFRDHVVMWSKDVQRTVDYLETRPDIARDRIGYLGLSWGAAMGTIMVATEPRFTLAIFHVGGFYFQRARPEVEAINFAPRVRVPSLMLNGRYDMFFPEDTSQRFMFQLLGVPEPQKRWVVYETGHTLPRLEAIKETLGWLDRHFGAVPLR